MNIDESARPIGTLVGFYSSDLMKIVYMNAQYLILYVCRNVSQSEARNGIHSTGTCPDDRQEVKIYGRTTVLTSNVLANLVDIVSPRTCVGLTGLSLLTVNSESCLLTGSSLLTVNSESCLLTGSSLLTVNSESC